jgi:hypothetical protein
MKNKPASRLVTTRVLLDREIDSIMADIGARLLAEGYAPQVHTARLLSYEKETSKKQAVYGGLFLPIKVVAPGVALPIRKASSKAVSAVVKVTDLPISFSVETGEPQDVVVGHAFGVSAPDDVRAKIEGVLRPFAESLEYLEAHAADFLVGRSFNKKVAGVECDHCGHAQEVTIPVEIARIDGSTGYGPGGTASVVCSNPECHKSFDVTWDSVVVEIGFTH